MLVQVCSPIPILEIKKGVTSRFLTKHLSQNVKIIKGCEFLIYDIGILKLKSGKILSGVGGVYINAVQQISYDAKRKF